ncbi:MAG: response regulator [Patescibacteria group bacterium]
MKVLIIDDDNFIREVYKSELNQENIEVELAESGEVGLEKVKSIKVDLILLDMMLPQKSGFDVLTELKKDAELSKIPVIVFSSLSQQSDIDEAKRLGCLMYLPKDTYSPNQIVDEIKKIILGK